MIGDFLFTDRVANYAEFFTSFAGGGSKKDKVESICIE